jgi:hypothetical protein
VLLLGQRERLDLERGAGLPDRDGLSGVRRREPVAASAWRGVKLNQLERPWPSGVSTIAISVRTPWSPTHAVH